MANLVVLECHLWLNLTEIRNTDKTALLYSPVLSGFAVDGSAELFTMVQKKSQVLSVDTSKCPCCLKLP